MVICAALQVKFEVGEHGLKDVRVLGVSPGITPESWELRVRSQSQAQSALLCMWPDHPVWQMLACLLMCCRLDCFLSNNAGRGWRRHR